MIGENDMNDELNKMWIMNWLYVEWDMLDELMMDWIVDEMNYIDDDWWMYWWCDIMYDHNIHELMNDIGCE